jgi:hypothetical protein
MTVPGSAVDMLSSTCANHGVSIQTSATGSSSKAGSSSAGSASAGSTAAGAHFAMPTGVAAAVAVVGAVGAML